MSDTLEDRIGKMVDDIYAEVFAHDIALREAADNYRRAESAKRLHDRLRFEKLAPEWAGFPRKKNTKPARSDEGTTTPSDGQLKSEQSKE